MPTRGHHAGDLATRRAFACALRDGGLGSALACGPFRPRGDFLGNRPLAAGARVQRHCDIRAANTVQAAGTKGLGCFGVA